MASTGTPSTRQYLAQSEIEGSAPPAMVPLSPISRAGRPAAPAFKTPKRARTMLAVRTTAAREGLMTIRFDTKIAIAVRADLEQWQKLNVTAFLASGIAASAGDVMGKPYEDASGNTYLELFRQPVVVYAADAGTLAQAHQRALARAMPMAIYTMDMFQTGHDDDNRAAVRAVMAADLRFAGLALYGPRNAVDKIFKGTTLHP